MTILSTSYKYVHTNSYSLSEGDSVIKNAYPGDEHNNIKAYQSSEQKAATTGQVLPSGQEARMASVNSDIKDNPMLFTHKEGELHSLLNALPFSLAVISPDGKIDQVNEAFSQLTGYAKQELNSRHIHDIFIFEDQAGKEDTLTNEILNTDNNISTEKRLLTRDGNVLYVIIKATVTRNNTGMPQQLLLQIVDITERKEFEELLQKRNEQLEEANKELDRFVYSTSHDLRAPLRSILGLIYIMQSESDPATQKTYLEMMRSSVNRMDAFIKEIVELSKNSMQDIKVERVELKPLISEIFESLRYIPGAEKIEFSSDVSQAKGFYSDISRLKIILNNLVSNAVMYHNFNQEQPFIKVQASVNSKFALIEVIDNGRGIKKEHQEKIFDMFYRASEDTKGSGLGLFIVKEAIAKLKGNIRLKSKWGAGTKFSIKIINSCTQ